MKFTSIPVNVILALTTMVSTLALSQQPAASPTFEVVSIRQIPSNAPRPANLPEDELTSDGWRLNDESLFIAIFSAYSPSNGAAFFTPRQIQGLPKWAMDQRYTIDAKVAEADLPQFRNPATQTATLHAMLQSMLADRCKLTVHRDTKEESVYSLVLAKNGPKFKESGPTAPHPHGGPIPGGGEFLSSDSEGFMHFYGAPLSAVAVVLSNVTGRPVQDDTGLTGRYDLAIQRPHMSTPSQGVSAIDDGPTIFSIVGDLGLKLVPAKRSVETLVIDHIEPPSEN
jgi:bla regulator protein BlaR1